jgi:hypothetical protein
LHQRSEFYFKGGFGSFRFKFDFQITPRKMPEIKRTSLQGGQKFMVFGAFSRTIHNTPVQAVLKTLDLECFMLEDDLEHHRLTSDEDVLSILCFRQFVRMVKAEAVVHRLKALPPDHLEFYKETIVRLVNAKELPAAAMEQFEHAFPLIM